MAASIHRLPVTLALADPEAVAVDDLPALVVRLAALQAVAAARLYSRPPENPDRLLSIDDAAIRLATTTVWLKRHRDLPFRVELSPGVVRYSERGIDEWIATRRGRGSA